MRINLGRRKAMMCQEVVEVITDYLEGTLPSADRARFEAHLELCVHCRRYLDQFRLTIEESGGLKVDDLSDELAGQLLDAFRGWRG
jgi:anti-sigma factor RsiW